MTKKPLLTIESCWSYPKQHIAFLDDGIIFLELKNNSNTFVDVNEVRVQFQTEENVNPFIAKTEYGLRIKSNNIEKINIPFKADLSLKHFTNSYQIHVDYTNNEMKTSIIFENIPNSNIIIHSTREIQKKIFISHRDPDDTVLGERLSLYLTKIGFEGYLAEKDSRPGLDIWDGKIFPTIKDSILTIVIWTPNAAIKPQKILKEVVFSKKQKKHIILLTEKGLRIPAIFPRKKEYVRISSQITEEEIIKLVESLEKTYKQGGYN